MAKKEKRPKRELWTPAQVWEQIVAIIVNRFGDNKITPATVTRETPSGPEGLNLDSLDSTELVMELDEGFDIAIPDEVVPELRTIGDTEKLILQMLRDADRLTK